MCDCLLKIFGYIKTNTFFMVIVQRKSWAIQKKACSNFVVALFKVCNSTPKIKEYPQYIKFLVIIVPQKYWVNPKILSCPKIRAVSKIEKSKFFCAIIYWVNCIPKILNFTKSIDVFKVIVPQNIGLSQKDWFFEVTAPQK